jgi:hypothetical protein
LQISFSAALFSFCFSSLFFGSWRRDDRKIKKKIRMPLLQAIKTELISRQRRQRRIVLVFLTAYSIVSSSPLQPQTTQTGDCKLAPGYYCVYDAAGVCTVTQCPANSYCPGGGSVDNPANPGINLCPAGSTSPIGSTAQSNCIVPPGKYWDGSNVVTCQAGNYCLGGPVGNAPQTKCPNDKTSNAGATSAADCFCPTNNPLFCSSTCVNPLNDNKNCGTCGNVCSETTTCVNGVCTPCSPDPQTDRNNCGACGNACLFTEACVGGQCVNCPNRCVAGSTCTPLGTNQTPTCICNNSKLPYYTPSAGTCGSMVSAGDSETRSYTVTPGKAYSITYDSYSIPDR